MSRAYLTQVLVRLAVAVFVVLSILAIRAVLNAPLDTAMNSFATLFGIWWVGGFMSDNRP